MRLIGCPENLRELIAKIKLLGSEYPHYLKGTRGMWLSSSLSVGFYAIVGDNLYIENLPIQTLSTRLENSFKLKPFEDILWYPIDDNNFFLFFMEGDILKSIVRCDGCDLDFDDRTCIRVLCKYISKVYTVSMEDFSIKKEVR